MNRKSARERMMQIYYQLDIRSGFPDEELSSFLSEEEAGPQYDYCAALFRAYRTHRGDIDRLIDKYAVGWSVKRMAKTDIAILRLAAAEILYLDDVPDAVAANEAVELAKRYGTDHAPQFVNAILGSIIRERA